MYFKQYYIKHSAFACRRGGDGCLGSILRVGGMPWPKIEATHYHAQLELQDKSRILKKLVFCWLLSYLITWAVERVTQQFTHRDVQGSLKRICTQSVT